MNLFDALRLMHWEIQVYSIFEFYNINKSGRIGYYLQLLLIIEHIIILSKRLVEMVGVGGSYTILTKEWVRNKQIKPADRV